MMRLTTKMLVELGVRNETARTHLAQLNRLMSEYAIDSELRVAHFLAQVLHESGKFSSLEENLNYSAKRLREVFSKYFSLTQARGYAGKPKRIGSRVYANRMGNGNEASGDGYRYRGRGFIQLTGKNNYRSFSAWVGEDVVAQPDLVATKYPLHSAVYYWDSNNINRLSDSDNVYAVTRAVNGRTNGIDDRIELLHQAKRLLRIEAEAPLSSEPTHVVVPNRLNVRTRPVVTAATRIGSLPQGTAVAKLGDADVANWSQIRTRVNGQIVEGVVASAHLDSISRRDETSLLPSPTAAILPPANLREGRRDVTRSHDGLRAFPLGESGLPRRTGQTVSAKVRAVNAIIDSLDSQKSTHRRYWPKSGTTYCNIYAHDYCYLAGAYLPRVWWTASALDSIRRGNDVRERYAETVHELNANALLNWLEEHGASFGWLRVFELDVLQASANRGEVCLLVAQRADLNRSGHIVTIAPESNRFIAVRKAGRVMRCVESQAGARNRRRVVKPSAWWAHPRFQAFGLWRHP